MNVHTDKPPKKRREKLRPDEIVRLFFAAKPGLSDLEVSKATRIPEHLVNRFRDPSSRIPYRRHLARHIVARVGVSEISAKLFSRSTTICCPHCMSRSTTKHGTDRNGIERLRCKNCGRVSNSIRRAMDIRVSQKQIREMFDGIAAGLPLRTAFNRAKVSEHTGGKLVNWLLVKVAELSRCAWRIDHKTRKHQIDKE